MRMFVLLERQIDYFLEDCHNIPAFSFFKFTERTKRTEQKRNFTLILFKNISDNNNPI